MTRRSTRAVLVAVVLGAVAAWLVLRPGVASIPRSAIALAGQQAKVPLIPTFVAPGSIQAPAPDEPAPEADEAVVVSVDHLLGPPRWHPRPPGEWDGMRVNLNLTPPCEASALCGLARACKGGKCMPCEADVAGSGTVPAGVFAF